MHLVPPIADVRLTKFFWRDLETGHITVTSIDRCPPGHVRSDSVARAGKTVRTPFHMMDSMQKSVTMHTPATTFDTAGPSRISDSTIVSDALAGAPSSTKDLAFKTMQAIGFAKGSVGGSRAGLDNYVSQLRAFARQYGTHGHMTGDASAKAACQCAAAVVNATADAFEAMAHG